ncbi:MAG TPA: glycosyltransferase [Bryobacteraceae bacterium]|nr:glycosyltransferase [Bryobacteraceae bacterium]
MIYALGGGWGHLTRAAALARAASARGISLRILTNSPYAARVARAMPELDLITLSPHLPVAQAREEALRWIRRVAPACLIVDTFPRGLGGELADSLPSLAARKVLIHRDLNPHYVRTTGLRDFVRSHYDLILIPGEDEGGAFSDLPAAVVTAPWLIRSSTEVSTRSGILICAAGTAEELPWYGAIAALLRARCVAPVCPLGCPPECWLDYWPAADLIAGSSVVIGGAGYNTVHECLAYRVPLIARPWPRTYDRQWLRARRATKRGEVTIVRDPEEAAAAALKQLQVSRPPGPIEFRNGADESFALLE